MKIKLLPASNNNSVHEYLCLKSNVHVSTEPHPTFAWQLFLELAVIRRCCEMFRGNEYCKMLNRKQKHSKHRHNAHTHIMYTDRVAFRSPQQWHSVSFEGCKLFWQLAVHQWLLQQSEARGGPVYGRSCAGALSLWGWSSEAGQQTMFNIN